jgi:hypothetical protein
VGFAKHSVVLIASSSLLSACVSLPVKPAPQKLEPWTTTLRDQQPEGAFAAVYRIGSRHLVFIGAEHENQNDSPTFRMIRDGYASFKFDTVIAEGFPTSWGANPARILDDIAKATIGADGFVEGGETVPTVLGAQQQAARLYGGEADDPDVKRLVAAYGITDRELLGFYVLRNLPQWISERALNDAADRRLRSFVEKALARQRARLQIPVTTLPDYVTWVAWYEMTNGKPLDASFNTEEVGPLSDGRFGTNKIAYAVSKARDAYLHRLIIDHLKAKENVLVVFGGSHLMIHRPALDAALGRPCYTGTGLKRAVIACR